MYKSAKLWVLFILIILLVNSNLFILASGLSDGESFGKVIVGDDDYSTYLTKMKIGYNGGWQYMNRYTTEPHEPSYIFLFYILLGHLARIFELNLHFTFHATRFILAFFALKVLYDFISKYTDEQEKLTMFLLAVFLSGSYNTTIDVSPQYHLYAGMMGFTHYMLTLICLLIFFDSVLAYVDNKGRFKFLKACLSLNILAVVHPFMVVLAGLVITGTVILNKKLMKAFPILAVSAASCAPLMLYFLHIFTTNPALIGWRSQATADTATVYRVFLYGLGSLFSYLLIAFWSRGKIKTADSSVLFIVWLVTALVLSFTKLITSSLQWFFFASVPVACLNYKFIKYLDSQAGFKVKFKGRSVVAWLILLILVLPTANLIFLIDHSAFYMLEHKEEYNQTIISAEDMKCYAWLRKYAAENDIVLAANGIGNIIPFVTDSITFLGHEHETLDYKNKLEQVEKFFGQEYSEQEAGSFLSKYGIKYIVVNKSREIGYSFLNHVLTGRTISLYEYTGSRVK